MQLLAQWGDYGIRAIGVSPGAIADTAGVTIQAIPPRELDFQGDL